MFRIAKHENKFLSNSKATTCYGVSSGHHQVVDLELYEENLTDPLLWRIRYRTCKNRRNAHYQPSVFYILLR